MNLPAAYPKFQIQELEMSVTQVYLYKIIIHLMLHGKGTSVVATLQK